jgi:hypothetical protein
MLHVPRAFATLTSEPAHGRLCAKCYVIKQKEEKVQRKIVQAVLWDRDGLLGLVIERAVTRRELGFGRPSIFNAVRQQRLFEFRENKMVDTRPVSLIILLYLSSLWSQRGGTSLTSSVRNVFSVALTLQSDADYRMCQATLSAETNFCWARQ